MSERQSRKGSKWRAQRFYDLCHRDGCSCRECGEKGRRIWRQAGVFNNFDWHRARYTAVNASSNLEIDHIVPLSEGGSNDLENLWLLCVECHKRKTSAERSARLKKLFADWREAKAA